MTDSTRSSVDQDHTENDPGRIRQLYEYLIGLTSVSRENAKEKLKESEIAKQWGMTDNRIFIRRMVRSIEPEKYYNEKEREKEKDTIPNITLGRLVNILHSIDKYRKENESNIGIGNSKEGPLTRAEKLKALQLYAQLFPQENQTLGLEKRESHLLLEKLVQNVTDPNTGLSDNKIVQIYQDNSAYTQDISAYTDTQSELSKLTDIKHIIEVNINNIGKPWISQEDNETSKRLKQKIQEKIEDVLGYVEYQNGARQLRDFLEDKKKREKEIDVRFTPREFIERLTKSTIENEILNQDFPISIKYTEFKELQSFPVEKPFPGIQSLSRRGSSILAYSVRIHYSFKNADGIQKDFYEEVVGLGSQSSHAVTAINRTLLWDIPSIGKKGYVPIAKEISVHHEIVGCRISNSVWGHHTVSLCKRRDLQKALKNKDRKQSLLIQEISHGEFCGFDVVETTTKAAFYARLRAIQQAGISKDDYIKELEKKVAQIEALREGERKLDTFPFSLTKMANVLHEKILCDGCYKLDNDGFPKPPESPDVKPWTLTEYEAHLSIAEAYLEEGLYLAGKKYLDVVNPHVEKYREILHTEELREDNNSQEFFIGNINIARYYLCCFNYHYLTDLEDRTNESGTREIAIQKAHENLNFAYKNLESCVNKCNLMDELSYVNVDKFFKVMSRLHAHKAKLYFFMSPYQADQNKTIDAPRKLFNKARMFAARSGDPSLYAMWAAYESWCYLVEAYEEHSDREKCIKGAKTLLDIAMLSYEKVGKRDYESLKVASGNVYEDEFSKIIVKEEETSDPTAAKKTEIDSSAKEGSLDKSNPDQVLVLNMTELSYNVEVEDKEEKILLFGIQSFILLFARGMMSLCKNKKTNEDFRKSLREARQDFIYSYSFAEDGLKSKEKEGEHPDKIRRVFETDEETRKRIAGCVGKPSKATVPSSLREALNVQHLRGIYTHRLTQFADLGKIYFIVCEMILLLYPEEEEKEARWNYSQSIIDKLISNETTLLTFMAELLGLENHSKEDQWLAEKEKMEEKEQEFPKFREFWEEKENQENLKNAKAGQLTYNGHLQKHYESFSKYFRDFREAIQADKKPIDVDEIEAIRCRVICDVAKIIRTGQTVGLRLPSR
jgi:hypothetical protein